MTEDKYQDCKASPLMFIYLFYLFNFDKYCKRNSIDFFFFNSFTCSTQKFLG